ncbi:MAG TPA: hypothetical protein VE226_04390 [Nitrososphaeraceae archaeon]|nr:hypothetical protein [Nitrososphaeraceae archaeon]
MQNNSMGGHGSKTSSSVLSECSENNISPSKSAGVQFVAVILQLFYRESAPLSHFCIGRIPKETKLI